MASPESVYARPCKLRDTLKQYIEDQPPRPNSPIDTAAAANAFSPTHLQKYLDLIARQEKQKEEAQYDFQWENEDGGMAVPSNEWSQMKPATGPPNTSSASTPFKGRKNGKQKNRKRALRKPKDREQDDDLGDEIVRSRKLFESLYKRAHIFQGKEVSLLHHGSRTKTGWYGKRPPPLSRAEIRAWFEEGRIGELLVDFTQIPYTLGCKFPTLLFDSDELMFLVRTSQQKWLQDQAAAFYDATHQLLARTLAKPKVQEKCRTLERGPHLPCILGHARQYDEEPVLTVFHTSNLDACDVFMQTPVVKSIISWAESLVRLYFPGIAERYQQCKNWHFLNNGTEAMFGLFFQFCINGIFPGQTRVHCSPHTDSKNVIGVCLLMVYETPGKPFDHKRRSWLVIWEPAVMLEIPPWVAVLYPSSLFLHFNIDIKGKQISFPPAYLTFIVSPTDVKLVTVPEGETPTQENTEEIGGEEGRGSLVFFNQASLFQSSETNSKTLKAAERQRKKTTSDFPETIQALFSTQGTHIPTDGLEFLKDIQ